MYDVPTSFVTVRLLRLIRSRSLMDKMLVCGTSAPGSIPGESTITKASTLWVPFFVCAPEETVPAHSFVRNRKSERCELANE